MFDLMRYNQPLNSFFDEFEKTFNRILSYNAPNISENKYYSINLDIKEEQDHYIVTADLPGIDRNDIKITIDQYNNLVIKGKKEIDSKTESKNYICLERQKGAFYRRIPLPGAANTENIGAKYQNGVLNVIIPKAKDAISREIAIEN